MKKTWRNIIIISLIMIIAEVVVTIVFLHPFYKTQLVYNAIDRGNWIETQECYEELSSGQKDRVQEYLLAYGAWVAREYAAGIITYEHTAATFDAINAIDETDTIYDLYMVDISKNEYLKVMRELYVVETSFDNSEVHNLRSTLNAVSLRLDNTTREELLIRLLNEKYQEFLDEKISPEDMHAFIGLVVSNSIYGAYDYALVLSGNVDCVVAYRSLYENAMVKFSEEDYFSVMDICNSAVVEPKDSNYQTLFSDLYSNAYETGKVAYKEKLDYYVRAGENQAAVELMVDIELRYGDDFDISGIKEELASDWQKAALELAEKWDEDLEYQLKQDDVGEYILTYQYDVLRPDSILLYDIDGNETPELFLFNQSRTGNDYVECFVYVYVDGKYQYKDYINVMNFCSTSSLVAFPVAFDRTLGEECMLVEFDGESFTYSIKCQKIESIYYVDDVEVNDADYLSAQSKVLANINEKVISNADYVSLFDCEKYILSY
ncbi:MAG: hypothetical protein E7258_06300 [Lachnospiraceae bacterium]|nr:hypothetical protein [Lachnospiraceae bacterium]